MSFSKLEEVAPLPDLVGIQRDSYDWLLEQGLSEVFREISPIEDYTETYQLIFGKHYLKDVKNSEDECRDKDLTYAAPLFVEAAFINKDTGEIKEQEVFMGDFPMMTQGGTFIINGTERVVVSQLVRSLASLESRDVMLAKFAGLGKGQIARTAWLMQALQAKFVALMEALKEKLPAAEEPAAAEDQAEPPAEREGD